MNARIAQIATTATVAAAALFAPAASAAPEASDLERVSNLVQPAIVNTETTWTGRVYDAVYKDWLNGGKPFTVGSSCSGFFVSPDGHVASAGHCVDDEEGRDQLLAAAAEWSYENDTWNPGTTLDAVTTQALDRWKVFSAERSSQHGPDREVVAVYSIDGEKSHSAGPLPARVLGLQPSAKGDVALMKIEAEDTPTLELASDTDLSIGTEVVSVGYGGTVDEVTDATFDPSFKDGTVSSHRTVGKGLYKVYEVSAAVTGGMSGGPTVDLDGRVVGVNSFGHRDETQPFNFMSPTSELEGLLDAEGVESEAGELTELYRAGVMAFHSGDRDEALKNFDAVLEIEDGHGFARSLRTKAEDLPETGGLPVLPIVAVLLLAGIGGAAWLMRGAIAGLAAGPRGGGNGGPRPALVGVAGPLAGQRFEIDDTLVVGRENGDLVIEDAQVSRLHAEFELTDGDLVVADLGSSNGTDVNGRRCEEATVLADGDRVQIGETVLMVELPRLRGQATVLRTLPSRQETVTRMVAR
jgi:serine protease Do